MSIIISLSVYNFIKICTMNIFYEWILKLLINIKVHRVNLNLSYSSRGENNKDLCEQLLKKYKKIKTYTKFFLSGSFGY